MSEKWRAINRVGGVVDEHGEFITATYANNLEAENRRLRTALEEIADSRGGFPPAILIEKERIARAALEPQPQAEGAPGANGGVSAFGE